MKNDIAENKKFASDGKHQPSSLGTTDFTQRGIMARLILGVSGQAFAKIATALNTLVLVPVLIHAWGANEYGQWIAIGAFASYLAYSNFGLVTPSANEIIMAMGAGDTVRACRTFQMSINLALYIILPLLIAILIGLLFIPISKILNLTRIGNGEALVIVTLFAAQLWFGTLQGIMLAALYATGSYGFGYYIIGLSKLLELIAIALAVSFFQGTQVSTASIMTAISFIDLLIVAFYARLAAPWARFNLAVFDQTWLRYLVKPTIGFTISNLSTQGVLVQGPRVILSALLGGEAVALYAVYATAVRLLDQLLLLVGLPLGVEISNSAGANDLRTIYRLITLGTQFSWLVFVVVTFFLVMFGPLIFHFWISDRIPFSLGLLSLFLAMLACNQVGRISWLALISANRMFGVSFVMITFAVMAMVLGSLLVIPLGVPGMVVGGIVGEFLNSMTMIYVLARWLRKPISDVVVDMLNFNASFQEIRSRARKLLRNINIGFK